MKIRFSTWESDEKIIVPVEDIDCIQAEDFTSMIVFLKNNTYYTTISDIEFIDN